MVFFIAGKKLHTTEMSTQITTDIRPLSKMQKTALIKNNGVRIYNKIITPLLLIFSFDIMLKITVKTDITAMITEKAEILISSNV